MISIFPLWTFHLYVAAFQQHLHMEYISLRYDIPELVVWGLLTRKLLNQGLLLVKLKSSLRKVYGRPTTWLTSMEYLCHGWNTSWSFPHSWIITGFLTRLTLQVPQVEQKLFIFPEHLSSPPLFYWRSCYSTFSFMCMICRSLFVFLYFFFWPLCCLFRFTDSNYPFGIFKLFFSLSVTIRQGVCIRYTSLCTFHYNSINPQQQSTSSDTC
jgi:hypothetical protein